MSCILTELTLKFFFFQKDLVILEWHCVWSNLSVIYFLFPFPLHLLFICRLGKTPYRTQSVSVGDSMLMKLDMCFLETFNFLPLTTLRWSDSPLCPWNITRNSVSVCLHLVMIVRGRQEIQFEEKAHSQRSERVETGKILRDEVVAHWAFTYCTVFLFGLLFACGVQSQRKR